MATGPGGKYDAELTVAKKLAGATGAVLVVFDGKRGTGFACQVTLEQLAGLPEVLEEIARQIRTDRGSIPRDS
jgi:hypothetical protein